MSADIEESFWAKALDEYESSARRTGLYARFFSQAQGDEITAKANYLKYRVEELSLEYQRHLRVHEQAAQKASEEARLMVEKLEVRNEGWDGLKPSDERSLEKPGDASRTMRNNLLLFFALIALIFALVGSLLFLMSVSTVDTAHHASPANANEKNKKATDRPLQISGVYETPPYEYLQALRSAGVDPQPYIDRPSVPNAVKVDLNRDGENDFVVGVNDDHCGNAALIKKNNLVQYVLICTYEANGSLGEAAPYAFFSHNTRQHIVVINSMTFEYWFFEKPSAKWIVTTYNLTKDNTSTVRYVNSGLYRTENYSPQEN